MVSNSSLAAQALISPSNACGKKDEHQFDQLRFLMRELRRSLL